jgi:TRAP-type C4-dicarboxylate transport system substrate-binding protein
MSDAVVIHGQKAPKTGRGVAMFKISMRGAIIALALLLPAVAAAAEPIKLKLAFYTSDRASITYAAVKPFVDAVNAEANGLIEIEVYYSGALGKSLAQQPQLVLDGVADIAFIIPGLVLDRFSDNAIVELPGLYRSMREATLTYTKLIAEKALKGYDEFFVIGAYGSELESISARPPITSLESLKGKKIRVNNPIEGVALEKLGMQPVAMQVNQVSEAISSGEIDGAAVPATMLFEYGIARVAAFHYALPLGPAPLALLMNRKRFESLPAQAQDIIRKYSGEWAAARFIDARAAVENQVIAQLKSDARRKVIIPSPSDLAQAEVAFKTITDEFAGKNDHNRGLLKAARSEIAKIRATE